MIWTHFTQSMRETFPTRASDWGNATILFLWSMVLTFNSDLFTTTPTFAVLARVMPQETWALLCMIVGGGRLVMLLINGSWRRSPHLRAFAAFVSCFFWFQISTGILQAGTFGTGLAVYPVLFLLDVYNVFRSAGDAGLNDRKPIGDGNGSDA